MLNKYYNYFKKYSIPNTGCVNSLYETILYMDSFLCMCLFAISPADLALVIVLYASWVSKRLIVMHILWYRVS